MDYAVPTDADLADVRALNDALLVTLRSSHGEPLRQALPACCRPAVAGLTDLQVERLAALPFLLFSLHEQDDRYWETLFDTDPHRDLFAANDAVTEEHGRLGAAAIGFAWQLSRRNPYTARLVLGASLAWCQRLASRPLMDVLLCAIDRADLLIPRQANNVAFWRRLLGAGVSADSTVRRAAHLAALQMILTTVGDGEYRRRLPSAACRAAVPSISL